MLTRKARAIKNATKDDLQEFGGQEAFAEHPTSRSNRQQYYSDRCTVATDKFLGLDDALELYRNIRGTIPVTLQLLAQAAGGRFVPIPEIDGSGSEVMHTMADLSKEFSETVQSLSHAAADGKIIGDEARAALKELDDMDRVSAQLRAHLVHIAEGDE